MRSAVWTSWLRGLRPTYRSARRYAAWVLRSTATRSPMRDAGNRPHESATALIGTAPVRRPDMACFGDEGRSRSVSAGARPAAALIHQRSRRDLRSWTVGIGLARPCSPELKGRLPHRSGEQAPGRHSRARALVVQSARVLSPGRDDRFSRRCDSDPGGHEVLRNHATSRSGRAARSHVEKTRDRPHTVCLRSLAGALAEPAPRQRERTIASGSTRTRE